jgi:3-oxoacid CoA-transferase subunit A
MDKTFPSAGAAVMDIPRGASLAVGGFGLPGIPTELIEALYDSRATNLHVV